MANIVSLFGRAKARKQDWTQAEIAEFYRIEGALIRAGITVGTERGVTDEGDPWFVFFRADDGEVVIHLARIDGEYVLAGAAYSHVARGFDFTDLVRDLIDKHPMVRSGPKRNSNVFMHPAAMLIAIIGASFFKANEARADDGRGERKGGGSGGGGDGFGPLDPGSIRSSGFQIEARQAAAILASVFLVVNVGHHTEIQPVDTRDMDPNASTSPLALTALSTPIEGDGRLPLDVRLPSESSETLSKTLALVAILKDLQKAAENRASDGNASTAQAVSGAEGGEDAGAAASGNAHQIEAVALKGGLDHVVIELLLKMDVLPDIQAVRLVKQAAPGFGGGGEVAVITMEQLPAALVELIRAGIHADVRADAHSGASTPANLFPGFGAGHSTDGGLVFVGSSSSLSRDGDLTLISAKPSSFGDGDLSYVGLGKPFDAGVSAGGIGTVSIGDSAIKSDVLSFPSASPSSAGVFSSSVVSKYISYFMQHTVDVDVIVSGREVVLLDEKVLMAGFVGTPETVTFKLSDGSSISLVGQSQVVHDTLSQWG
jgi:hypothetical protein